MQFFNKKFLIFGMSKSGYSATECLLNLGAECFIYDEDDKKEYSKDLSSLLEKGAKQVLTQNIKKTVDECDVLVISPGIPINHDVCLYAKKVGKDEFYIPFDRQELADFLEVERSGLSVEISKLKREGFINSEKNYFALL